jgi:hypothetical protein
MSKTLIKLVDASIYPASLLVVSKTIGILFFNNFLGLNWGIEHTLKQFNIFSVELLYLDKASMLLSTSYSNLFMMVLMILGFVIKIIQIRYLHESRVSPKTLYRLNEFNLLRLIKSSFDIYIEGVIWLIFCIIAWLIILTSSLLGISYVEITYVSLIVILICTTFFLREISLLIEQSKSQGKVKVMISCGIA